MCLPNNIINQSMRLYHSASYKENPGVISHPEIKSIMAVLRFNFSKSNNDYVISYTDFITVVMRA